MTDSTNYRVIIIGGGVAGLSAGCYLRMNGYETEILEQHSISGGLCTSWKRGAYTFDGCVHWMLGSAEGSAFNRLWSELLDLRDMKFVNHAVRVSIETKDSADSSGNKIFHLHSKVDALEAEMLRVAPEDKVQIRAFTALIRQLQKYDLPPLIEKAPKLRTPGDKLQLLKMLPLILVLSKWSKVTTTVFAKRLKNPFLKEVFTLLFEGRDFPVLAMAMQLAYFDRHCAGYPIGGSLPLAKRLEDRYRSLGGRLSLDTKVRKILTRDGAAVGVELADTRVLEADAVISAADWHFTVFEALEGRFTDATIESLRNQKRLEVFDSAVLISLGVSRAFEGETHLLRFPLDRALKLADGSEHRRMEAHVFNYDPTMAPPGKTVVSVTLPTRNGDFWINLRETDRARYVNLKEEVARSVIDILDRRLGKIREYVEVYDVATPATFRRYTGNWQGSIQGWMPQKQLLAASPVQNTLPGLKKFYMIGHWQEPGGGLPIALLSARNAVQEICRRDGEGFQTVKCSESHSGRGTIG